MSRGDALSQRVIDLTSDNEELPNDGLPRFESLPNGLLMRNSSLGRNYTKTHSASASPSSRPVSQLSNGPRLLNGGVIHQKNGGITSIQRPITQPDSRHRRALDESQHNTLHIAKKQKLSGGSSEFGGRDVPTFNSRGSSPAVITGAMRASADTSISREELRTFMTSRTPPAGRIHKPVVAKPGRLDAAHFQKVLEQQVFPHVKEKLKPFQSQISDSARKAIGTDTVYDLVQDASFVANLKANGSRLSTEFEIQLAGKAGMLIQKYVLKEKKSVQRSSHTPSNELVVDHIQHSIAEKTTDVRNAAPTDSSSSVEPDEVFEGGGDHQGDSNRHGHSSVSPSTPLSNDVPNGGSHDSPLASIEARSIVTANDGAATDLLGRRRPARAIKTAKLEEPSYVLKKRIRRWHKKPADWVEGTTRVPAASPAITEMVALQRPSRTSSQVPAVVERSHPIVRCAVKRRPYLGQLQREAFIQELERRYLTGAQITTVEFSSSHVPFSDAEADLLGAFIRSVSKRAGKRHQDPFQEIVNLITSMNGQINKFSKSIDYDEHGFAKLKILQGRDLASISAFMKDAAEDSIFTSSSWLPPLPEISERPHVYNPVTALLRHREIHGLEPVRVRKALIPYNQVLSSYLEDCLVLKSQWTDSSGDVVALTWTTNHAFIVGALTHFDPKHMQYNKSGNLLVGSTAHDTLRAYPDHKIVRPLISSDEDQVNALDSMRRTQDPWLYASVVSASHSSASGYTFTSSFDNTAKVWKVAKDGSSMELCGTWEHEARVNFVATSEHHDRIATGSETHENAVRVYSLDPNAISQSPYHEYGGNKSEQQAGDVTSKWAYQPATMKWARAPQVANLLLVGYSPRAPGGEDTDIPENRRNTGELCVWNYCTRDRIHVASSTNVFEAIWHPTQPMFAAATSPSGNYNTHSTKTQVRIFALNDNIFSMIIALDCPAIDINELTIMPNSTMKAFVTASCTNAKTYVWDTAQGEDPIHVLEHGESLDTPDTGQGTIPVEEVDGGVTFASWGATVDRFYTGASDGKLKAWDIRKPPGEAFVRDVLEVTGGISSGAFTEDFRQLLVGDCTGKIYLLGIDEDDSDDEGETSTKQVTPHGESGILPTNAKRPKVIIAHPDPAPPAGYEMPPPIQQITRPYFEEGFLRQYPGRGMLQGRSIVFQGPNYEEMGLYCFKAHENSDGTQPLLPEFLEKQQFTKHQGKATHSSHLLPLPTVGPADNALQRRNEEMSFDFEKLSLETQTQLHDDDIDLDWDWYDLKETDYVNELLPSLKVFRSATKRMESRHKSEAAGGLSKAGDAEAWKSFETAVDMEV